MWECACTAILCGKHATAICPPPLHSLRGLSGWDLLFDRHPLTHSSRPEGPGADGPPRAAVDRSTADYAVQDPAGGQAPTVKMA